MCFFLGIVSLPKPVYCYKDGLITCNLTNTPFERKLSEKPTIKSQQDVSAVGLSRMSLIKVLVRTIREPGTVKLLFVLFRVPK